MELPCRLGRTSGKALPDRLELTQLAESIDEVRRRVELAMEGLGQPILYRSASLSFRQDPPKIQQPVLHGGRRHGQLITKLGDPGIDDRVQLHHFSSSVSWVLIYSAYRWARLFLAAASRPVTFITEGKPGEAPAGGQRR